jgi:hypothetical protein
MSLPLIKEAWSFARNRVTEEADLSKQAEIAALAETTIDSRLRMAPGQV